MLSKIRDFVKDKGLIEYGDKIVVGLSGGADSVCLLSILTELKDEYSLEFYAVHVNHCIREVTADLDEEFARNLAKKYGISFVCVKAPVTELASKWHMTEEEAGRKVRYDAFEEERIRVGADKIAVAHHMDDQAETILFRMCRGTGIKGMAGIPCKRDYIIRPLITVTKSDILKYLENKAISFREDETNQSVDYDRNRIRHNVIPELEKINVGAVSHIAELSMQLEEIYDWMAEEVNSRYMLLVRTDTYSREIDAEALLNLHPAVAKEIIRRMIGELSSGLKDIEVRHIECVFELAGMNSGKQIDLPYNLIAIKDYSVIRIIMNDHNTIGADDNFEVVVQLDDEFYVDLKNVYLPEKGVLMEHLAIGCRILNGEISRKLIPQNGCTKWFDCDKIKSKIMIRRPKPDDYFLINNGQTKKLARYIIDSKIPRQYRNRLLVIADGNHVMWVVGGRMGMGYYINDNTETVIEFNIQ